MMIDLVDSAREELLLVSYATYPPAELTAALGRAVARDVQVTVPLERDADNPQFGGTYEAFPGLQLTRHGAAPHAKVMVVDRSVALIGSANLTGHALDRTSNAAAPRRAAARPGPRPHPRAPGRRNAAQVQLSPFSVYGGQLSAIAVLREASPSDLEFVVGEETAQLRVQHDRFGRQIEAAALPQFGEPLRNAGRVQGPPGRRSRASPGGSPSGTRRTRRSGRRSRSPAIFARPGAAVVVRRQSRPLTLDK
jgi:hypothetical protein